MLDKTLVGRESDAAVVEVEKGAIRRFAEALGDPNPLYNDEPTARAAGYKSLLAPLTFAATLAPSDRFRQSLDLGHRSVLHGEQAFEYFKPIVAGDRLTVRARVAEVTERAGAGGPIDVLVLEDEAKDEHGQLVFKARSTLLLRRG